jgi:hypothetical protein
MIDYSFGPPAPIMPTARDVKTKASQSVQFLLPRLF